MTEKATKAVPAVIKMTRPQIKELRKAGLDPAFQPRPDLTDPETMIKQVEKNDQMIDWILDNIYTPEALEGCSNADLMALARDTYEAAYGNKKDEEKN